MNDQGAVSRAQGAGDDGLLRPAPCPLRPETVVLLHGLGRTPLSMSAMALAARRRGYRVVNWSYASKRRSIAENAEAFLSEVAPRLRDANAVHFITHSLGGIIVRRVLAMQSLPNLGRVVMLAPPNRGSEVADVLQRSSWLAKTIRPLRELGTGARSIPLALPAATFPVGVIAGSRSHIPLFARWMKNVPNDGVVAVERTKLAGMTDFVVLPRTHTFLAWAPDAIRETFGFLERGRFTSPAAAPSPSAASSAPRNTPRSNS